MERIWNGSFGWPRQSAEGEERQTQVNEDTKIEEN